MRKGFKKLLLAILTLTCMISLLTGAVVMTSATGTAETPDVYMETGAWVKVTGKNETGLKFSTKIKKSFYDGKKDAADTKEITCGTIIVPTDYIAAAGGYTFDKLRAYAEANEKQIGVVKASGFRNAATAETDGYYNFYGSIVGILESNYVRKFSGIGYMAVEKNDGTTDYYYANYTEEGQSRSVYEVVKGVYSAQDDSTKTLVKGYLDAVVDITQSESRASIAQIEGYTSPYELEETLVKVPPVFKSYSIKDATNAKAYVLNGEVQEYAAGSAIKVDISYKQNNIEATEFEACNPADADRNFSYKDYTITAEGIAEATATVTKGDVVRECNVTVKDGQISVSGSAFGADMYGDGITMRVLTDNGIEYIIPMTVVTKYVANYEDLTNMQLYGGLAPELCGGKADTENDYNYDGYFIMTDNIDCGGYSTAVNGKKIASLYYSVYNSADKGFKGVFDGKGFSIYNYWAMIGGKDSYKNGIFGNVQKSGVIKNLGIVGTTAVGHQQDGAFLAYSFNGTLENCYIDIHNTSYSCTTLGKDINSASFNDVVIKCGWDKYHDGYGPTDGAGLAYRLGVYGGSEWFNNAKPDNLVLFSDISHLSATIDKSWDAPFMNGENYVDGFAKYRYHEQPTQEVQFKDNTYWTLSDEKQPIFITSQNRQTPKS